MATGGPHEGNMEVFSDIYKAELDQRNELLQRELRDLEVKKLVFGNQERDFEQRVDAFEKNIARIRESLQEERQKLETKTQDLEKRERHFEDQQKKLTNHVDELKTNSQKGRDNFVSTQLLDEHRVKIELENRELQKQRQEIQDEWNKIKETQIANCEMAKHLNKTQEKVGDLWKALQVSKERSTEEISNLKRDLERQKLEFIESKEQTERELTAEKQTLRDEKEHLNAGKITLQNQIVEFQTESEQIRQILLKDKLDVQLLRENLQEDKLEFMKTAEGFQKDFNESLQDLKEKLEFLSLEKRSLEEEKQRFLMTKSESEKEQGRIYKILEEELDNLHLGKQSLETQVMDFREEIAAAGKILKEKETALEEGLEGLRLQRETLEKEKTNFQLTKFRSEEENKGIQAKELEIFQIRKQTLIKQMTDSEERNINSEQVIQDIQRVLQEERDCLVTLPQNLEEEKLEFMEKREAETHLLKEKQRALEEGVEHLTQEEINSLEARMDEIHRHIGQCFQLLQEEEGHLDQIGQELEAASLSVEDEQPPMEDESDSPTAASEDLGELNLEKTVTTQVPSDGNPTLHSPHDDDDVRELSLEKTKTNSEEEHKEKYECFLDEFQYLEAGNQSLEEQKMDSQENEKDSAQIHQEAQTLADHVLGTGYLLGTQYLGTQQWVRGHLLLGTRYRGPGYAVCPHNDETQTIELREEMQKASLNVEDEQPPVEDESDSPTAVSEDLGELNLEKTVTTQVPSDGNPTVPSLHDDNDELPENPGPAHGSAEEEWEAEEDWEAEEPTPSTSGLGSSWD
nr:girdin-like [Nothobranchius furzeri]